MLRRAALAARSPAAVAAGCGGVGDGVGDGPTVVATTTQLADMARNIAPGAHVTSLLSPNTDPHEYEVRPDDVKALASADIVLRSGGEVDEWLDGALDAAGVDEQDVVDVGAAVGLEGDDPHWWQDPRRAEQAAAAIGARVRRARGCRTTRRAYVARLKRLDAGVRALHGRGARARSASSSPATTRSATSPRRYGITVDRHRDPGADDRRAAVGGRRRATSWRRSGARASRRSSPRARSTRRSKQAIAREAGARIGTALWADSLGPKGSDGATYIGSIEANTRALVQGFTGGAVDCPVDA